MNFSKLNIKAVLIGAFSEIVLALFLGFLLGIVTMIIMGVPEDPAELNTLSVYVFSIFIGAVAIMIGGYITAKLAKQNIIYNVKALGCVLLAVTIIAVIIMNDPIWFEVISVLIVFPFAYLGGLIWLKKNK